MRVVTSQYFALVSYIYLTQNDFFVSPTYKYVLLNFYNYEKIKISYFDNVMSNF